MSSGHIAHLFDRWGHPDKALNYDNILYSCPENPRNVPNTCGHAQGNKTPSISPLDEDCETHFTYSEDGRISGKNDQARDTIRMLNLNGSRRLCESRRLVFEETRNNKNILSPHEFGRWLNNELKRQPVGTFKPYWTTIHYAANG